MKYSHFASLCILDPALKASLDFCSKTRPKILMKLKSEALLLKYFGKSKGFGEYLRWGYVSGVCFYRLSQIWKEKAPEKDNSSKKTKEVKYQ